jgi:hypothetical protein
MEQKKAWIFKKIGKVDAQFIADNIIELKMNTGWFNYSGVHYQNAILEINKLYNIKNVIWLKGGFIVPNYYLLFVGEK